MKNLLMTNKLISYTCILGLFMNLFSCNNLNNNENYIIPITFYKEGFIKREKHTMLVECRNIDKNKLFTYKCKKLQLGIKILKIDSIGNLSYDNQKLQFIDIKKIKVSNSLVVEVKKYINADTSVLNDLSYFYLNNNDGLILTKNLVTNNIILYNTKRFKNIHEKIVNDSLLFKNSKYVIEMNKDLLKLNDHITK